jgi:hypothetical protein
LCLPRRQFAPVQLYPRGEARVGVKAASGAKPLMSRKKGHIPTLRWRGAEAGEEPLISVRPPVLFESWLPVGWGRPAVKPRPLTEHLTVPLKALPGGQELALVARSETVQQSRKLAGGSFIVK